MKIAILGAGAWGTALAISFAAQHRVALWTRDAAQRDALRASRGSRYLPQVPLPDAVEIAGSVAAAVEAADVALIVTPTAGLREAAAAIAATGRRVPVLWACKGFESASNKLPHEVIAEVFGDHAAGAGALSGPSFALEVARGLPTALTLASSDAAFARDMARALHQPRLRVYYTDDVVGVEVGGAVKNVMAIATGISDGLGLGLNARAALITRGLAEITRLGVAMGGRNDTFMGLTGMGDLILTCTGDLSRNRKVGLGLGAGQTLDAVLASLGHVAEGVNTAREVHVRAQTLGVDMPITRVVCAVLFEGLGARKAVEQLLSRDPKAES
jgi:glycerol-3-phosphate dehydrogenase (NAD(P)+)